MNLHLAHYYRVQALFRELGCPQKRGSLFCKPLRGQSLPGPSPPCSLGRAPPISQAVPSCLPHPPSLPGLLTMGFLNSLGLMQRTKKGWQAPSVRISSSSDRLNWLLSVGERFLVSAPWGDGPQRWEGLTLAPPALQKGSRRGGQQSGPDCFG